MTRVLLTIVLPLLLPAILYGAWLWVARGRSAQQPLPWVWAAAGGIVLMIASLALFGFEGREVPGVQYVPPRATGSEVVPGQFDRR